MGEAKTKSLIPLNAKMTKAIGELLSLARAGRLHGFAYASIIEDAEGYLASGSNAIWNGDPKIGEALTESVETLHERMKPSKPKSGLILHG